METRHLTIRGARVHNLKNVDLELLKNELVCLTGVSGSGKSSLAFDTVYAEGQRRYVESLSAYARQFLGQMEKPDVDQITGLSPTISIEQKKAGRNPRSTVGTITEIYDYLRVLFARVGTPHCTSCGRPIGAESRDGIVDRILALEEGRRIQVLAPLAQGRKGEYLELFEDLRREGYIRARVDGKIVELTHTPRLERYARHDIEVVIDRLEVRPDLRARIGEAVDAALALGKGTLIVSPEAGQDLLLSSNFSCTSCGLSAMEPTPQLFSFNSPQGMCPTCRGLGTQIVIDPALAVPDETLSVAEGAIAPLGVPRNRWKRHYYEGVLKRHGASLKTAWNEVPKNAQKELLHGLPHKIEFEWKRRNRSVYRHRDRFEGIFTAMERRYAEGSNPLAKRRLGPYVRSGRCPSCGGSRLRGEAMAVKIEEKALPEVTAMTIGEASAFFDGLALNRIRKRIAEEALKEIRARLRFLLEVGLDYLTLDRTAPSLAGGEAQRIRLAGQIGSGLVGVTYVLDEPSIGLHHRDNARLLDALCRLRDSGNTVIVVEHDEETMRRADRIVDFGPGPGHRGGSVVVSGSADRVARAPDSLTGAYLSGRRAIPIPERRRVAANRLTIRGARQNNLRNIDVGIPLGVFTCVTGVSGSGKSSLIDEILYRALARDLNGAHTQPGLHRRIEGTDLLAKVVEIDQRPIGRTPRSNPATYTGAFTPIRDLFARLPEAKARGYAPGRFSFNVKGGRCEACRGNGANLIEMDFLADVWITCPVCEGRRFNRATLDVRYKGASIRDVLEMEVGVAADFFKHIPAIHRVLGVLVQVGMGYVHVGQPAPTLSGGEAQRIKLAKELCRINTGRTLYILDEPTTGLHFADVQNLLNVLQHLVDHGNSVIVIEHNLDVIKTADWIIDLGPEGGEDGGAIVAVGTPEKVVEVTASHTGRALRGLFNGQMDRRGTVRKDGRAGDRNERVREIEVFGAKEHNLKNVDVKIPRERMTVVSGISGSGKTSLALDTVFAEGQRRYVESLSTYARQFLSQARKPRVDRVVGLSPAISIEQKTAGQNPRSTVGTITEVYDYLRALFGLLGSVYCPECSVQAGAQSAQEIVDRILDIPKGRRLFILAPQAPGRGEDYPTLIERARRRGFVRSRLDGIVFNLEDPLEVDPRLTHRFEVLVDRIKAGHQTRGRISDSTETALNLSGGVVVLASPDDDVETRFSQHLSCPSCGNSFEPLTPQRLSFNSPGGWCPACEGLGTQKGMGRNSLIPNPKRSIIDGGVVPWGQPTGPLLELLKAVARDAGFDLKAPISDFSERALEALLYGLGDRWLSGPEGLKVQFQGLFSTVEALVRLSPGFRREMGEQVQDVACPSCRGSRLNPESAAVRFRDRTLTEVVDLPIEETCAWFRQMALSARDQQAAGEIVQEIRTRLSFLDEVGLGYLALSRRAPTLSGGEAQRIRLASQIGSGLTGVLYVLDEPTIGLHQRDNQRLLSALKRLRDLGNTLVVVEHDRATLEASDYILDFGPGAGTHGGRIVAAGRPSRLGLKGGSLTARYLKGKLGIDVPKLRRPTDRGALVVKGARQNNLKDLTVRFPLSTFTCVTGVSGSGKSSLVNDILFGALAVKVNRARQTWGDHDEIEGLAQIDKAINIDQTPIGYSPRSNPATYVKAFDAIRQLYSQLPSAKVRGYQAGQFSFNSRKGRCEACEGLGSRCIEMHFLPDVWVTCEVCDGKRYNRDVLDILYKGRSIADVLDMTLSEALTLFENVPRVQRPLKTLDDVGLGYLKLCQASTTLSGGEAQRVKLAKALSRPNTGRTVYLLDEPTTGLHVADIQKLLDVLNLLVDGGNTVIVVEHNLDVIKTADWVIDLGPEGGDDGGFLVAAGTPEAVAETPASHTGRFLRQVPDPGQAARRPASTGTTDGNDFASDLRKHK